MQLQCMEAIAATADAVMSGQPTGWHVGLEESDAELIQESEQVWFDLEELGGMLYSTEPVPEKPSEYDRIEVLHETHGIVIELDFGIETIRLYVTKNNERHVLGAFEHLVKKTGDGSKGEDDDSSSESENVEASPAAASSEASEKPAQDTESADHSPESHDRNPYWIDGPSSPFAPDYQTFYDYYHAGPISPSYSPYEPTEAGSPKPEAETEAKPEPEKALKRQHPEPERPEPYEPENKKQKSDSAFPEFEYLDEHIKRFDSRPRLIVDPKRWQDYLRSRLEPYVDEETIRAPGKDTYHGLEDMNSRHVNPVVKAEPPIKTYLEETVKEFEYWKKLALEWRTPIGRAYEYKGEKKQDMENSGREISDEALSVLWSQAESPENPYKRTLCEMYRLPCPDCGFLMLPGTSNNGVIAAPCFWRDHYSHNRYRESIDKLICTACHADKFVEYPLPECPFRKPPPHQKRSGYCFVQM